MNNSRKWILRRCLPILLLLLALLSGCSGEKEVTFHDLSITLPAGFSRDLSDEDPEIDYYTSVSRVQVRLQRMTYLSLTEQHVPTPEEITAEQLRQMLIQSGSYEATLCEVSGAPAFVYEFEGVSGADPSLGSEMYKALCCVYKSEDALWLVEFSVPVAHYEQWEADFHEWAKTVRIAESDAD